MCRNVMIRRGVGAALLIAAGFGLAGCQDQRNEFNPVRFLCPGDFDSKTNTCNIPTGSREKPESAQ
tara:strand:- start:1429 stop:1626 length:198 start_codon:yes stop_codon:yes gene_type:complete